MKSIVKKIIIFMIIVPFISSLAKNAPHRITSLAYTQQGQGPALVLIHAFPTDQQLWQPQYSLQKHFNLITIDLPGFGHSLQTDGEAMTMDQYAASVKQILDKLHIQKAIIGGESMGGYVALAFLKNYPNQVAGLILSDTQTIADTKEAQAKREQSAEQVLAFGSDQLIQGFMTKALSTKASKSDYERVDQMAKAQSRNGIASALRGMAMRSDTTRLLRYTKLPILIITGEKDILISPQQSYAMNKLAHNSKLVVIPGAGHLSSLEKPHKWNQAVIAMFAQKRSF